MTLTTRTLRPRPDLTLTLREGGSGSPLLVLHGELGPTASQPSLSTTSAATTSSCPPTSAGATLFVLSGSPA